MNQKFIDYFINQAIETSKLSYAKRLKVGVVAVRNNRIVLNGYNGTLEGYDNVCEYVDENGALVTKQETYHAEENLILYAAKHGIALNDSILFCTHQPCIHCAKMIVGVGIKRLYYRETYRLDDGLNFMLKSGIDIIKLD